MLIIVFSGPLQQEELMGWHPSVVQRTRIRVIGENFSDFLIGLAGSSSYRGSTVFALSTKSFIVYWFVCHKLYKAKKI